MRAIEQVFNPIHHPVLNPSQTEKIRNLEKKLHVARMKIIKLRSLFKDLQLLLDQLSFYTDDEIVWNE